MGNPIPGSGSIRVPARFIKEIAEKLNGEELFELSLIAPGGNTLIVRRGKSSDQYGNYDYVDMIWNEGD